MNYCFHGDLLLTACVAGVVYWSILAWTLREEGREGRKEKEKGGREGEWDERKEAEIDTFQCVGNIMVVNIPDVLYIYMYMQDSHSYFVEDASHKQYTMFGWCDRWKQSCLWCSSSHHCSHSRGMSTSDFNTGTTYVYIRMKKIQATTDKVLSPSV